MNAAVDECPLCTAPMAAAAPRRSVPVAAALALVATVALLSRRRVA